MLLSYLTIAFRSLQKQAVYSCINTAGLAIGMAACLMIFQYLRYEYSYDRQSPAAENIWRAYNENLPNGGPVTKDANTHSALGPALKADLPEVEAFTRLFNHGENEVIFSINQRLIKSPHTWLVDTGFLKMFPVTTLAGNPLETLRHPYRVILTQSMAKAAFGDNDPIGQPVKVPGGHLIGQYTVGAVVADPPPNTHLKFSALASYETRHAKEHQDNWNDYWEYTYFQVQAGSDIAKIRNQLNVYSENYLKEEHIRLDMQPLTDIHLYSDLTYEIEPNGSARSLTFLSVIALFILVIAFINFINLSTARSLQRSGEVGLRKAIGAKKSQLIVQFLTEGLLINTLAFILGLLLISTSMPVLEQLTGKPISNGTHYDRVFWSSAAGLYFLSILLACLYPAVSMTRFKPIDVLKGRNSKGREGLRLRQGLVVVQFACSIALIFGVVVVLKQLIFMQRHDKGLSLEQLVALKTPGIAWGDTLSEQRWQHLKQSIEGIATVRSATVSSVAPGLGLTTISGTNAGMYWVKKPDLAQRTTVYDWQIDENFIKTYQIKTLAGALGQSRTRGRQAEAMINESALRMFGFSHPEEAIGAEIAYSNSPSNTVRITGVLADFHIEQLKLPPKPTLYFAGSNLHNGYLTVSIQGEDMDQTLSLMEPIWRAQFPETPFEYYFMDQHFASLYQAENQFFNIFSIFALLAILIACLGLFGLAVYSAERRRREIGIRKVLGASVTTIATLLSIDFLKLVLLAICIAGPLAWFLMQHWLQAFAIRIELKNWMILSAGAIAFLIALITIGVQSIQASLQNPVKILRNNG